MNLFSKYKDTPHAEHYQKLNRLVDKVLNEDNPTKADCEEIEKLLLYFGMKPYVVKSLYQNCGFNSWIDFLRDLPNADPNKAMQLQCVKDKLADSMWALKQVYRKKIYDVA